MLLVLFIWCVYLFYAAGQRTIVSRRTISFSPIHQPTVQNSPLSSVLSILHY